MDPINVYLIIPENFEELVEKTDLTLEQLERMHHYDQQWGHLVSKLYIVPAKEKSNG